MGTLDADEDEPAFSQVGLQQLYRLALGPWIRPTLVAGFRW